MDMNEENLIVVDYDAYMTGIYNTDGKLALVVHPLTHTHGVELYEVGHSNISVKVVTPNVESISLLMPENMIHQFSSNVIVSHTVEDVIRATSTLPTLPPVGADVHLDSLRQRLNEILQISIDNISSYLNTLS